MMNSVPNKSSSSSSVKQKVDALSSKMNDRPEVERPVIDSAKIQEIKSKLQSLYHPPKKTFLASKIQEIEEAPEAKKSSHKAPSEAPKLLLRGVAEKRVFTQWMPAAFVVVVSACLVAFRPRSQVESVTDEETLVEDQTELNFESIYPVLLPSLMTGSLVYAVSVLRNAHRRQQELRAEKVKQLRRAGLLVTGLAVTSLICGLLVFKTVLIRHEWWRGQKNGRLIVATAVALANHRGFWYLWHLLYLVSYVFCVQRTYIMNNVALKRLNFIIIIHQMSKKSESRTIYVPVNPMTPKRGENLKSAMIKTTPEYRVIDCNRCKLWWLRWMHFVQLIFDWVKTMEISAKRIENFVENVKYKFFARVSIFFCKFSYKNWIICCKYV